MTPLLTHVMIPEGACPATVAVQVAVEPTGAGDGEQETVTVEVALETVS